MKHGTGADDELGTLLIAQPLVRILSADYLTHLDIDTILQAQSHVSRFVQLCRSVNSLLLSLRRLRYRMGTLCEKLPAPSTQTGRAYHLKVSEGAKIERKERYDLRSLSYGWWSGLPAKIGWEIGPLTRMRTTGPCVKKRVRGLPTQRSHHQPRPAKDVRGKHGVPQRPIFLIRGALYCSRQTVEDHRLSNPLMVRVTYQEWPGEIQAFGAITGRQISLGYRNVP